ncbi:uncharacterized protein [Nicotiana sylvestris]|uniref:uncharacterized protein n=1 Tax=Nicotiana sylvestris TaxID=4096 RepID=UPI00388C3D0B
MASLWPFTAWGMDMIGPIEPVASNGHRFILVAIDYFTKWVEASTYKAVIKKLVADFVRNNIVCIFEIPESIATGNAANLNSCLVTEICEEFKIIHRNSTAYRPQMNGAEITLHFNASSPNKRRRTSQIKLSQQTETFLSAKLSQQADTHSTNQALPTSGGNFKCSDGCGMEKTPQRGTFLCSRPNYNAMRDKKPISGPRIQVRA